MDQMVSLFTDVLCETIKEQEKTLLTVVSGSVRLILSCAPLSQFSS